MYSRIWRLLPGGTAVKLVLSLVLLTLAGLFLWQVVFPLLEPHVDLDPTMSLATT
ncbi:hypothetical protein [Planotetraspora silvatica]|nr:hypothetical protein [Planotetraspora silvatica]